MAARDWRDNPETDDDTFMMGAATLLAFALAGTGNPGAAIVALTLGVGLFAIKKYSSRNRNQTGHKTK